MDTTRQTTIPNDDLLKYRKKHFTVEVKPCCHPSFEGEKTLSITHNGSQWQTIGLMPWEIDATIKALADSKRQ
jgi:hypothetical protein